jgi:hypothetical protein
MGIGLSISRSIVEAHSGRIRAERAGGGGARFVVSLPAADGARAGCQRLELSHRDRLVLQPRDQAHDRP